MRSALLVAVALLLPALQAASTSARVALTGSVQIVDNVPPTPAEPHKPYISRASLHEDELAKTMNFEVVLQMQNFADLQQRVAKGERISQQEMTAKYQPSAANYQTVVDWLVQNGFIIRQQDPGHVAVFASGTVAQIKKAFAVSFARVKQDGVEYSSATTAPTVPVEIGNLLVGINGLQPFSRPHRHAIIRNSTSGAGAPFEPSQMAQAYDASTLYNYNITGQGQTIAIVIDALPLMSDLTTFWSDYGVNRGSATVTFIQAVAGTLPATSAEDSLDTEWTSSIAPGANVRVYATLDFNFSDIDQAYAQVYSDVANKPSLNIHEMTMSFGAGESYVSGSQLTTDDQYFAELTAAGVTVFASAGDVGATPDSLGKPGGANLITETPSSDPYVAGVGGTSLGVDSNGNEASEVVWNNGYDGTDHTGATGGGRSNYFAKPSWQTGTGVNKVKKRQVPDIASDADPQTGGYVILNGATYIYGGTSLSSPTWAGFCALLNQARANVGSGALGLIGPDLYPLLGTDNFRDITSGNNIFDSTLGYTAGVGYDSCTGCGAPDVTTLAKTLSGSATLAPNLASVASVQSQGGTNYSIALPLTGAPGVECRRTNGSLQLVFTFIQPVVSGDAEVTDGTGEVGSVSFSGNAMTVNLNGVTDAQSLTVTVSGINNTSATNEVSFDVLQCDVNGDGAVNAQDVTIVRNAVGSVSGTSGFNPKTDINEDGAVNAQDVTITRNAVGNSVP